MIGSIISNPPSADTAPSSSSAVDSESVRLDHFLRKEDDSLPVDQRLDILLQPVAQVHQESLLGVAWFVEQDLDLHAGRRSPAGIPPVEQ